MSSSHTEKYFDPDYYTDVFSIICRMHLFMITLFFERKKHTNEYFLTIESLEKLETIPTDTEKKKVRAFRLVIRNLSGRSSTQAAMERLSQTLNKIPRCLVETFDALVHQRPRPTQFISIFTSELMRLMDESEIGSVSSDFIGFVAAILLDIRELYEAAGYYRLEEFLFIVRNKFLSDLEAVHLVVNFYLEFGQPQLAELNTGGSFISDLPAILNSLVSKLDGQEGHPREIFEALLASSYNITLPDFDCF